MAGLKGLFFFSLFSLVVGIAPAGAAAPLCADIYTGKESATVTEKLETRARELITQYKSKFLVPENRLRRIRYSQMQKAVDVVREVLRKINVNSYPFLYMREGFAQEIRLWVKTGEVEGPQGIESLIKRYKDYPMNLRLLIERTAFIRTQHEFLNSLLTAPESKFPISVEIPQAIQKRVLTETIVLNSKDDVRREIAVLKANEGTRFDGVILKNFSNGVFFRGREREQAQLEQILTIAYRELKKFPLALRDAQKRADLIADLEKVLANKELQTTAEARYVEARRQFTAELLYFTGKREFDKRGEDVNDKIWLNDRNDLGIDSERLGPVSRMGRTVLATVPLQALGALIVAVTPTVHKEVRENLFQETYMQEIAHQEDAKFQKSAYEFLKSKYDISIENGQWVMSAKAREDLAHLQELNREFKADAKKEHETTESFQKLLLGDEKPVISDEQFKRLMSADEQQFSKLAQAAAVSAAKNNPNLNIRATVFRLFKAYGVYHETLLEKADTTEALGRAQAALLAEPGSHP